MLNVTSEIRSPQTALRFWKEEKGRLLPNYGFFFFNSRSLVGYPSVTKTNQMASQLAVYGQIIADSKGADYFVFVKFPVIAPCQHATCDEYEEKHGPSYFCINGVGFFGEMIDFCHYLKQEWYIPSGTPPP